MLDPSGNTIFKEQKVATMEEYMFQAQLNSKTYLDRMPRIISCNPAGAPTSGAITIMPDGEILGTCPTSSAGSFEVTPPIGTGPVSPSPQTFAYQAPLTGGTPYGGFESAASQDAALQEAIAVSIMIYSPYFQ